MKNPENPTLQENEFLRRIVVKFVDDFELPYEDGAEEYLPDDLREQWDELAQAFPGITLRRLFRSITPERILELVRRAVQTDPTYKPPNFLTFFAIDTPQNSDPSELVEALAKWEVIQYVYLESPLAPLPAVPPTGLNPEMILQAYLDPPHLNVATGQLDVTHLSGHIGGIDARFAWNFGSAASAGSGVTFIDIEKAWVLNHEDLVDPSMLPSLVEIIDHLPGPSATTIEHCDEGPLSICRAHGTSVLGILVAQDNPVGCVGIAYEAAAKVISIWEPPPSAGADPSKNIPDAILAAASNLTFGDVMLLELQINPSGTLLPVELEPAIFEKIRLSTALGISVIEAAANGGQPLDTTGIDDKDSGAVIVGAANATGSLRGQRHSSSNFGTRVNCYAWGDSVTSTSDPSVDSDGYTNSFDATSSASAIVAGAAILVQAIAKNDLGVPFSPFQLRDILSNNGPQSVTHSTEPIGVMPNLGLIIGDVLNLTPDVYVRDNPLDDGSPHTGSISASPDVNVRTAGGSGSGTQVFEGEDHVVYVSARNRGGAEATGVRATVYYSTPASLVTPDMWVPIGTSPSPVTVPVGTTASTALTPIPWTWGSPPITPGHYCFIATIGSNEDPDPVPNHNDLVFMDFDDYREFIRRNNNVTWRNFNVETMSGAGGMGMAFMARGWPSQDLRMRLEVVGRLPEGARMWLEGPAEFMDAIVENRPYLEIVKEGVAGLPINPHGVNRFREIVFPAKSRNQMQLLVEIPENQQNRAYRIYARQLYKGEEVGRVTWQLEPPSKVHRPDLSTEPVSHWIGISLLALALGWLWLYIWHWLRKQGRRS